MIKNLIDIMNQENAAPLHYHLNKVIKRKGVKKPDSMNRIFESL
jgi:hypothetical protein